MFPLIFSKDIHWGNMHVWKGDWVDLSKTEVAATYKKWFLKLSPLKAEYSTGVGQTWYRYFVCNPTLILFASRSNVTVTWRICVFWCLCDQFRLFMRESEVFSKGYIRYVTLHNPCYYWGSRSNGNRVHVFTVIHIYVECLEGVDEHEVSNDIEAYRLYPVKAFQTRVRVILYEYDTHGFIWYCKATFTGLLWYWYIRI